MDLASVVGLLIGVAAIIVGQLLEGGELVAILQPAAAMLVFGGTLGATLLSVPLADARLALRSLGRVFRPRPARMREILHVLNQLSVTARRDGLVALESHPLISRDPLLQRAMQHVVDGTQAQTLREILDTEIALRGEREAAAAQVFEAAGGYAPTMGILGAVLGLMHVMRNLSDPSQLGEGIAVAFVATVYGVALANVVCLPIARKLRRLIQNDQTVQEMVIEGALAIQAGSNPRALEARLHPYLSFGPGAEVAVS